MTADAAHGGQRAGVAGWVQTLTELTKVRITAVVTLTVATGFILFAESINTEILLPMAGTFLLACGSAALNQVQEAGLDARMPRTRRRPIPAGRIGRDWALLIAVALLGAGMTTLASIERHTTTLLLLGGAAVVWYNGLYVLLKRWTAFAVVPGSAIGAIPPAIGWVSAGGLISDPTVLMLGFFFFLWQIPHFWLLLIRYGDEYQRVGMPSLTATFSPAQLGRITCVWIVAVAVCGILLVTTGRTGVPWNMLVLVASLWLGGSAFGLLRVQRVERLALPAFVRINVYALLIMIALVGDALW